MKLNIIFIVLFQLTLGNASLRGSTPENSAESFTYFLLLVTQTRVIGGSSIDEDELDRFPYFTLMYGTHMCGGVLIAPNIVVSAAHCQNAADHVRVGIINLPTSRASAAASPNAPIPDYIEIEEKVQHPSWGTRGFAHDIMVMKLKESSSKQYAMLNVSPSTPTVDDALTLIGFGDTTKGGGTRFADTLQEAELEFVDADDCRAIHPRNSITNDMLCATATGKGSCHGDSGGPLILKGDNIEDDLIVATVSWGRGCASEIYPSVYSSMSAHYNWILETACALTDDDLPEHFACNKPLFTGGDGRGANNGDPDGDGDDTDDTQEPSAAPSPAPSTQPSWIPTSSPESATVDYVDFVAWSAPEPYGHCQGDCDNDNQCADDMICYREGTMTIPGCAGLNTKRLADYCIYPSDLPN